MSWYTNPQLFIYSSTYVYKVTKKFGINPISKSDLEDIKVLSFSEHLSMDNNKESDFKDFKASFPKSGMFKAINCEGLVINWDKTKKTGAWSREEQDSPFWSLPGITKPKSETEQALAGKVSDLEAKLSSIQSEFNNNKVEKEVIVAENSVLKDEKEAIITENLILKVEKEATDKRVRDLVAENATLKAQVKRERDEKNTLIKSLKRDEKLVDLLEKQVSDLKLELVQCCGAARVGSLIEEPWITGQTVLSNWVPIGELDVLAVLKNTTLPITKVTGGSKSGADNTTNVKASCFSRRLIPIVVVDVANLSPNKEKARFDPCVWGSYEDAGIMYAARKPFAPETSVNADKTR